ncbi:MAG: calcium-binding protein, partial [Sneathiellaceae bacterium]
TLAANGTGADVYDGGAGTDLVDYVNAAGGVAVDLGSGATGGAAAGDSLAGIENLRGSNGFGDTLAGDGGANLIHGLGGDDSVAGGAGGDTLSGGNGADSLDGGDGGDTLAGDAGDDVLAGGLGADRLDGGAGNDTASYADAAEGVRAHLFYGGQAGAAALGDTFGGIENLTGSAFNDTLLADDNANRLEGGAGDDLLASAGGDDSLLGGDGNDTLAANGSGADVYDGGAGIDLVNYVNAAAGVAIDLGAGTTGGAAAGDSLSGVENLQGSNGFGDTLAGDDGANLILGLDGNDILSGGGGDDTLEGGGGADSLDGGAGVDMASYAGNAFEILVDLGAGTTGGGAAGDTLSGIENLQGADHADSLTGDSLDNRLDGGAGADRLIGGAGNDSLDGGDGSDRMTGGSGDDIFVFDALDLSASSTDTITDFSDSGDDSLDLTGLNLFASPGEALALAMQAGNDITFDFDGDGNSDLILTDTALGLLSSDDFLV